MINYDLPFGLCRMDTMTGTITRASSAGIDVALDMDDPDIVEAVKAFVRCGGKVGQRVLVSLKYFNKKRGNFFATLDGFLDEGPMEVVGSFMSTGNQQTAASAA